MNFDKLAENMGLEEEEYQELAELFVESCISDLEKLQSALNEADAQQAAEAAHSIKGAAGSIRQIECHEVAKKIELEARNGRLGQIDEWILLLKDELDVIAQACG